MLSVYAYNDCAIAALDSMRANLEPEKAFVPTWWMDWEALGKSGCLNLEQWDKVNSFWEGICGNSGLARSRAASAADPS